jgi:hypothetical protein
MTRIWDEAERVLKMWTSGSDDQDIPEITKAFARGRKLEEALIAMRDWHLVYHGADPCKLCILAKAALAEFEARQDPPEGET